MPECVVTSMEAVAQMIANKRLASRLTQRELAELAGLSERTVQRVEEDFIISPPTLWKLLDALELDMFVDLRSRI